MVALDRLIRRLVSTTLPLSMLSACGPGDSPLRCNNPDPKVVVVAGGGLPDGGAPAPDGGPISAGDCQLLCGNDLRFTDCTVLASDGGTTELQCRARPCLGRRPAGLAEPARPAGADALGAYFAEAAHLEAASVPAFLRLREELVAHAAPRRLVEAAARAARDEARHARCMRGFAERRGVRPWAVRIEPQPPRPLEELAAENAVEGCVRELYGAVVSLWQAHAAGDLRLRATMRAISLDELRHSQLALDVAAWAGPQLSQAARRRVAETRRAAHAQLEREAASPLPASVIALAGVPSPRAALALARGLPRF